MSRAEKQTKGGSEPALRSQHRGIPPGQLVVEGFPRFGRNLATPPPRLAPDHAIAVTGHLPEPLFLPVTDLEELGCVERIEDFHCVAGWTTTGVHWRGVPFARVWSDVILPQVNTPAPITHLTFRGADGHESILCLDDALADDVLLATGLGGAPLSPEHGAPVRLVSPRQYGYLSTKHLVAIALHTERPRESGLLELLLPSHARARVWQEERHPWLPAAIVRPTYRRILRLAARRGHWTFQPHEQNER